MNAVDKHVVSNTLSEADLTWAPTSLIRGGDLVTAVTALEERPGGDVNVMGSAALVRLLLEVDLVDELNLMIEPMLLGGGESIFPTDGAARRFELVSATTAPRTCRFAGISWRAPSGSGRDVILVAVILVAGPPRIVIRWRRSPWSSSLAVGRHRHCGTGSRR